MYSFEWIFNIPLVFVTKIINFDEKRTLSVKFYMLFFWISIHITMVVEYSRTFSFGVVCSSFVVWFKLA